MNLKSTQLLLIDLVSAFVEKPEEIVCAYQEAQDGSVYWMLRGAPEDEPKLIGREGCHVDSLAFLVSVLGDVASSPYTFRLITENRARRRDPLPRKDVLSFDPKPARNLLEDLLLALDFQDFKLTVGPGSGARQTLSYDFEIKVHSLLDYEDLTVPRKLQLADREIELSLVAAIGTLFRAIARKGGVVFQINITKELASGRKTGTSPDTDTAKCQMGT